MKRWLCLLALLLCLPTLAMAQPGTSAQLSATTCPGSGCVILGVTGLGSAAVQVTGTWSGTLTFEGSIDGVTYVVVDALPTTGTTTVTTTTANGVWVLTTAGLRNVRIRFSAYVSGTANVSLQSSSAKAGPHGGGGGGALSPSTVITGCSDTQVLFDDAGVLGCDSGLVFAKGTNLLTVGTVELTAAQEFDNQSYTSIEYVDAAITQDLNLTSFYFNGFNWNITVTPPTNASTVEYDGGGISLTATGAQPIDALVGFSASASQGVGTVGRLTGMFPAVTTQATVTTSARAIDSNAVMSGGSTPELTGLHSVASAGNGGTATLVTAGFFQLSLQADSTTVTTARGVYIAAPELFQAPAVTNLYGLSIADQTLSGTTLNYAIDVNGLFRVSPTGLNVSLGNGGALQTDTTTAHTACFAAVYDVDGMAHVCGILGTNGNTPTLNISAPSGGTMAVSATTTASGLYTDSSTPTSITSTSMNSCGTTSPTFNTGSGNSRGSFNVGATSGTDCTLTFSTAAAHAWVCAPSNETSAALVRAVEVDTTSTKFLGVFGAADKIGYSCAPY